MIVIRSDDHCDAAADFWRKHPSSVALAEFAVHLVPGDLEVQSDSIAEPKLAREPDLYERSGICLLGLRKLRPMKTSSVLAVVDLVVTLAYRPPNGSRERIASTGDMSEFLGDDVAVAVRNRRHSDLRLTLGVLKDQQGRQLLTCRFDRDNP